MGRSLGRPCFGLTSVGTCCWPSAVYPPKCFLRSSYSASPDRKSQHPHQTSHSLLLFPSHKTGPPATLDASLAHNPPSSYAVKHQVPLILQTPPGSSTNTILIQPLLVSSLHMPVALGKPSRELEVDHASLSS